MSIDAVEAVSGEPSDPIALDVGTTNVSIVVRAEAGNTKRYAVAVNLYLFNW